MNSFSIRQEDDHTWSIVDEDEIVLNNQQHLSDLISGADEEYRRLHDRRQKLIDEAHDLTEELLNHQAVIRELKELEDQGIGLRVYGTERGVHYDSREHHGEIISEGTVIRVEHTTPMSQIGISFTDYLILWVNGEMSWCDNQSVYLTEVSGA